MGIRDEVETTVSVTKKGTVVAVWATPGAARTELAGLHGGAIKVRVRERAHGGAANRAIERFLTELFGAPVVLLGGMARSKHAVVPAEPGFVIDRLIEEIAQ